MVVKIKQDKSRHARAALILIPILLLLLGLWNRSQVLFSQIFLVLSIVILGITLLFILQKLMDSKPGLVLNDEGIINNMLVTGSYFTSWGSLVDLKEIEVTKLVLIFVHKPEEVINTANGFTKFLLKRNKELLETPFIIDTNRLKCGLKDTVDLIQQCYMIWEMNMSKTNSET